MDGMTLYSNSVVALDSTVVRGPHHQAPVTITDCLWWCVCDFYFASTVTVFQPAGRR